MTEKLPDLTYYWTSPKIVLKCVGPKLVPYFKTVAIYFVLVNPRDNPSWFSCLIKCLPIMWLCIFVVLHGMSLGEKHAYSRRILAGLIFSIMGDALLVWPSCFFWGMIAFGMAHIAYISAFGMRPLNLPAGVVCFGISSIVYLFLYPGLYGHYTISIPLYIYLLSFMMWRAVARVQFFEDLWTWTKLCSCGGGILFALSDGFIGISMFHTSFLYVQTAIMITYYAAQLGIALSVVDSKAMAVLSAANASNNTNGCCIPFPSKKEKVKECIKMGCDALSCPRKTLISSDGNPQQ